MKQFNHVVLGGTFDHFHKGHQALLTKAFEVGKKVTIGIATEEIYKNKFLFETVESFEVRKKSVSEFLKKKGWLSRAKIVSFSHYTGGADKEKNINAIIVSKVTFANTTKINQLREKNKLPLLKIVIINDILAEDGKLISSERIRAGEIDREGKKYQISNINPSTKLRMTLSEVEWVKYQKDIKMPENLREELRKPLGQVFEEVCKVIKFIKFKKPIQIIAVGDIIVDSLLKSGIDPDVKIIDFRSRRRALPKRTDLYIRTDPYKSVPDKGQSLKNNPGTINLKTSEIIKEKIKKALFQREKSWIVIDGEEDLLTLPVILFAPLNSLVLYGHWQLGIVVVEVNEKIKEKVKNIIKKFL